MQKANDIIAIVRYDGAIKSGIQKLMETFDKSEKEEDIYEVFSVVNAIQKHIAHKHPEVKDNEIIVLFEEEDEVDLTILINSTPSTQEFAIVGFPNGERGIVF